MIKEIKDNHLFWDGCDTVALAKEFGTHPCTFFFSGTEIRTQWSCYSRGISVSL